MEYLIILDLNGFCQDMREDTISLMTSWNE
jgi:hypothetical protein